MPAITLVRRGCKKEIVFTSAHIVISGRGDGAVVHVPEILAAKWRVDFRPEKGDRLVIEDDGFGSVRRGNIEVRTARLTRRAIFLTPQVLNFKPKLQIK